MAVAMPSTGCRWPPRRPSPDVVPVRDQLGLLLKLSWRYRGDLCGPEPASLVARRRDRSRVARPRTPLRGLHRTRPRSDEASADVFLQRAADANVPELTPRPHAATATVRSASPHAVRVDRRTSVCANASGGSRVAKGWRRRFGAPGSVHGEMRTNQAQPDERWPHRDPHPVDTRTHSGALGPASRWRSTRVGAVEAGRFVRYCDRTARRLYSPKGGRQVASPPNLLPMTEANGGHSRSLEIDVSGARTPCGWLSTR